MRPQVRPEPEANGGNCSEDSDCTGGKCKPARANGDDCNTGDRRSVEAGSPALLSALSTSRGSEPQSKHAMHLLEDDGLPKYSKRLEIATNR